MTRADRPHGFHRVPAPSLGAPASNAPASGALPTVRGRRSKSSDDLRDSDARVDGPSARALEMQVDGRGH